MVMSVGIEFMMAWSVVMVVCSMWWELCDMNFCGICHGRMSCCWWHTSSVVNVHDLIMLSLLKKFSPHNSLSFSLFPIRHEDTVNGSYASFHVIYFCAVIPSFPILLYLTNPLTNIDCSCCSLFSILTYTCIKIWTSHHPLPELSPHMTPYLSKPLSLVYLFSISLSLMISMYCFMLWCVLLDFRHSSLPSCFSMIPRDVRFCNFIFLWHLRFV